MLVEEGAPSHGCVYVLLYGRVRLSMKGETEGKVKILSDHGRGTLIGEGELLTGGAYKVRQIWPLFPLVDGFLSHLRCLLPYLRPLSKPCGTVPSRPSHHPC